MRYILPIFALCFLACAGSTPLAEFKVKSEEVDASCSKLTDFCMRATCAVKNTGKVPGQVVVDVQLLDPSGKVLFSETARAEMGPGDSHTIVHEFTEVKLGTEAKVHCEIR